MKTVLEGGMKVCMCYQFMEEKGTVFIKGESFKTFPYNRDFDFKIKNQLIMNQLT